MINKFTIENYKGFKTEKSFDLGRITLVLGANSSGKSALLNLLLTVIQSEEFPFYFNLNNAWAQLGNFKAVVNKHNIKNAFRIKLQVDHQWFNSISTVWRMDKKSQQPFLSELEVKGNKLNLNINYDNGEYVLDGKIEVQLSIDRQYISDEFRKKIEGFPGYRDFLEIQTGNNEQRTDKLIESAGDITKRDEPLLSIPLNATFNSIDQRNFFSPEIRDAINIVLNAFDTADSNFIGPYRNSAARYYPESKKPNYKVQPDGTFYPDQILQWQTADKGELGELVEATRAIGLFDAVKAERLKNGLYELLVKPHLWSSFENLMDVGVGIAQFLPIIVADLQLSNESNLYLAESEIHLHPSAQSKLAEYITKSIRNSGKSYFLETHSEYLLNKLRLQVVTGDLLEEELKIYFLEPTKGDTIIHRIIFNKKGQVEGAPESYFKTYTDDVFSVMINAME